MKARRLIAPRYSFLNPGIVQCTLCTAVCSNHAQKSLALNHLPMVLSQKKKYLSAPFPTFVTTMAGGVNNGQKDQLASPIT